MKKKKKEKWKIGEKIREIDTDGHQYQKAFLIGLIIANLVLILASIYFLIIVKKWYFVVMAILIILGCIIYSYITFKKHGLGHVYTIYDNSIILHSVWSEKCIHLENIFLVEVLECKKDKKYNTKSILIYEKRGAFYKTQMSYIAEDVYELKDEIMNLANLAREKKETQIKQHLK